ncbi:MAG TPA: lysylphosphatidylglycerol synthase domain-containing protein [Acidimicrobiia bacterium]|nr:lysylphosphatidylglycerol synthase domain-containing protein [Acidimicrobiia bacterium]
MDSLQSFRARVVSRVPDGVARRRPGDAVRVVVAVVVLAAASVHAFHPTSVERDLADWLRDLPDGAERVVLFFYDLLSLWAVGIVVTALVFLRRWRLARDLALAALVAWTVGRLLAFVVRQTDLGHAFTLTFDLTDAPRFPLVRVGVAVAVVTVASPYLARPTRRVGQVLVVLLGLAAMYLGRALPLDVLAAFVVGWGSAAAVHLAFGTPARRPTAAQVGEALQRLGVGASAVHPATQQPVGRAMFVASTPDGPLRVVALGRDEADAQFLSRMWRWVAYRDAPPVLFPTRRRQVEYEATTMGHAADAGARVPRVVRAGQSGAVALLVTDEVDGSPFATLDGEPCRTTVLDDAWRQLVMIHDAGLAHGRLDADHLVVHDDEVTVVGWERATADAGDRQRDYDVAQLLAAGAAAAGDDAAVDAALEHVGADRLVSALPMLQPTALAWVTRDVFDERDGDAFEALRDRAAAAAGAEPPVLRERYRVNPRQLLMAVGALVAVTILLSRVGDPVEFWESIRDANWWYVALAFVLGIGTDVAFAVAFLGTVPVRLALWPTIELQSSMSFSNLAVPVAADTAIQVRFLQKNGLDLSSAVAIGGVLSTVTELVVQAGLFVIALWLSPDSINFGRIDTEQIVVVVLGAVFLIGVAAAVVFSVQRLRHAVVPRFLRAARSMWTALASPFRIMLLLVGNVSAQCLYAASLLACLAAFGESVNFWTLVAINIGITLIASLVPFPGGGTAVSAVGISGLLTALGVAAPAASAAVIAHQLAVSYLPAIPGWFATNDLVKKRML